MLDWVLGIIGLLVLLVGTVTDLRTREVPDMVTYGFIAIVIVCRLLYALIFSSYGQLLDGVFGLVVGLTLGTALFYTGQWGGADAKLLWGLGPLFGLQWGFAMQSFFVFLVYLLLVGAVYGVLWSSGLFFLHRKKTVPRYSTLLNQYRLYHFVVMGAVVVLCGVAYFSTVPVLVGVLALLIGITFYLWIAIKVIEEKVMTKQVPVSSLVEGDWIAKDVVVEGTVIVGPKDLGVEKKHMKKLHELKVEKVWVKEGIPFVPSFLIAFVLTYAVGWVIF